MKLPGFMFYPGDWLKDPNLRRCSNSARGVWIDMLCLMFECEERGVLATAGRAWSDQEIAQAVGGDQKVALSCLHELVDKVVAGRNQSGAVFCRRMVRDEEQRKTDRERQARHRKRPGCHAIVTHTVTHLSEDESESETRLAVPKGNGGVGGKGGAAPISDAENGYLTRIEPTKPTPIGVSALELKVLINALFNRSENCWWNNDEEHLLCDVARRPDALKEFYAIKAFFAKADRKFVSQDVYALLRDWNRNVDKSRISPGGKTQLEKDIDRMHAQINKPEPLTEEQKAAADAAASKDIADKMAAMMRKKT